MNGLVLVTMSVTSSTIDGIDVYIVSSMTGPEIMNI